MLVLLQEHRLSIFGLARSDWQKREVSLRRILSDWLERFRWLSFLSENYDSGKLGLLDQLVHLAGFFGLYGVFSFADQPHVLAL